MQIFKKYYNLTKPGIIYGNLINATAGFLLGSLHAVDWLRMLVTLLATSLVVASACVLNNCLDRSIDAKMARTKKRALVTGSIPISHALLLATVLGVAGFALLLYHVSLSVAVIALVGFVDYVVLYGWAKRHTHFSTLVGSVAGATPVLIGYVAATNDANAATGWLAFLLILIWQMPHFYSIGLYRYQDYKEAGLPIVPVVKSGRSTKLRILAYIAAFTAVASLLTFWGPCGYIHLVVMLALGLTWLGRGLRSFNTKEDPKWGRQMFLFSLIVILVTDLMLALGPRLP